MNKFGLHDADASSVDDSEALLQQCRATFLQGVVLQAFGAKVTDKVDLRKKVVNALKAFPDLG
eukprot:14541684-Heterocapsa_arctica.AAC.1